MGRITSGWHKADKKIIVVMLFLVLLSGASLLSSFISERGEFIESESVFSRAVYQPLSASVIIESSTREIVEGVNYDKKLPMASTTKIVTAALACESGKLDEIISVDPKACGIEGSSIYLKPNEKMSLRDLTYGLMLRSGNDAACAIAAYLGVTIENFAKMMNDYAVKAGAENTNFVNPHGLHDDNHYTTAYDLAIITAKALENSDFREIVSSKARKANSEGAEAKYFVNKNKMLSAYEGAIGVKTGYTKNAGRCLVSAAERNGLTMISVVLNEPDMWNKSAANLDIGFDRCRLINLAKKDAEIEKLYIKKSGKTLGVGLKNDVNYVSFDKTININYEIIADEKIGKNAKMGDCVGKIRFYNGNRLLFEEKIYIIELG